MSKKLRQISIDLADEFATTPEIITYIRSCYVNLKLNRQQMIDRQDNKIAASWRGTDGNRKKLLRRERSLEKYPNEPKNIYAIEQITINLNGGIKNRNRRTSIISFLEHITDEQFIEINKLDILT